MIAALSHGTRCIAGRPRRLRGVLAKPRLRPREWGVV